MSKPWGMTAAFKVIVPTPMENEIYDVVLQAVRAGMTPQQFLNEVTECWVIALDEKRESDLRELAKARDAC